MQNNYLNNGNIFNPLKPSSYYCSICHLPNCGHNLSRCLRIAQNRDPQFANNPYSHNKAISFDEYIDIASVFINATSDIHKTAWGLGDHFDESLNWETGEIKLNFLDKRHTMHIKGDILCVYNHETGLVHWNYRESDDIRLNPKGLAYFKKKLENSLKKQRQTANNSSALPGPKASNLKHSGISLEEIAYILSILEKLYLEARPGGKKDNKNKVYKFTDLPRFLINPKTGRIYKWLCIRCGCGYDLCCTRCVRFQAGYAMQYAYNRLKENGWIEFYKNRTDAESETLSNGNGSCAKSISHKPESADNLKTPGFANMQKVYDKAYIIMLLLKAHGIYEYFNAGSNKSYFLSYFLPEVLPAWAKKRK